MSLPSLALYDFRCLSESSEGCEADDRKCESFESRLSDGTAVDRWNGNAPFYRSVCFSSKTVRIAKRSIHLMRQVALCRPEIVLSGFAQTGCHAVR